MDGAAAGTRLLIVSEHRIFRECLATVLQGPADLPCDFATCHDEAVRIVASAEPDVVLIDHYGRDEKAILKLTSTLNQKSPKARLLVIGDHGAEHKVTQYIEAGAAGFVTNGRSMQDLIDAIAGVVNRPSHILLVDEPHQLQILLGLAHTLVVERRAIQAQ